MGREEGIEQRELVGHHRLGRLFGFQSFSLITSRGSACLTNPVSGWGRALSWAETPCSGEALSLRGNQPENRRDALRTLRAFASHTSQQTPVGPGEARPPKLTPVSSHPVHVCEWLHLPVHVCDVSGSWSTCLNTASYSLARLPEV